ncbi:hypothetical protein BC332_31588 [Capsicum chinense]|nr:hypothetical protein BC332_31588 [Capsicum chinense]
MDTSLIHVHGSGKKNFTDLSKSPHGHSKKVHPKKSGRDSSRDLSVPVLINTIRILTKVKVQMASEVSSMLRNQVAKRSSAKEEASILQAELDSRTQRLETEKNELQLVLKKELDRRSSEWSLKLEKYQIEQHRLRERVRELAEQNVSLQREVSSFNEKEVDNRIKMSFSEKHLENLSKGIEQVSEENQNLRQQLTQLQAEYQVAQDNRDYVRENCQEKVKELKSETLLTTVLREKLYSEEMDIKKLQVDLAATVRGNDILKCEVKNALDALYYATPKLKYLELQVLKKDENINQIPNDLKECMKELGVVKAILTKVFQERDFMWEEVKSYSEMNMLLNYKINMLKRKSTVISLREGFCRKDQNSSSSSSEGCGSSVKRSSSADAGHLSNANVPCTGDGSTWNNVEGINSDKSIDSGRPSLALRSSSCRSVVQEPEVGSSYVDRKHSSSLVVCSSGGLEIQGGDSSTSTSANQQILDLNLALAFQEKLSDPRITSMLKQKGRHTDRELANLLQDKGLDPNFSMMLKENGLDPMILYFPFSNKIL